MDEREKTKQQAAVMLAFVEGKEIQSRAIKAGRWVECETPCWDWSIFEYRIKPEPPRKFIRYFIVNKKNSPNCLGMAYQDIEIAKKVCKNWNIDTTQSLGKFELIAFELTEIKENAS